MSERGKDYKTELLHDLQDKGFAQSYLVAAAIDSKEAVAVAVADLFDARDLLLAQRTVACAEHFPTRYHTAAGHNVRCECGWKSTPVQVDWRNQEMDEERAKQVGIDEWRKHVRVLLTPAEKLALEDAREASK